jgi:hypothetical protein
VWSLSRRLLFGSEFLPSGFWFGPTSAGDEVIYEGRNPSYDFRCFRADSDDRRLTAHKRLCAKGRLRPSSDQN